jgi:hypothetical protein
MAGIERRRAIAEEEYERTRREVAEHQVVDVAEDILGHAWVEHLEDLRRDVAQTVSAAAQTRDAAHRLLRAAQNDGDPRKLACAQRLLERSERDLAGTLAEGRRTLAAVERQLATLGRATLERVRRRHADLVRLDAARAAAFGTDPD